jgi:hypothetical protein
MSGTPTTNKKWRLDVDLSSPDGDNWAQVRGLNNVSPVLNNTIQDATDYDDDIWGSDAVTGRKWQITATALRKEYAGSYDTAQEYLRTQADALETVHVRWYERGVTGGEAYEGTGIVQWEPQGGDPTGLSQVNVTILGQGARVAISNPDADADVPAVNSLSPATGAAAGGELITITGSNFTGVTAVEFGADDAEDYTVVSSTTIVAVAPAHAAGTVQVKVTNGEGASANTAGDDYVYTA